MRDGALHDCDVRAARRDRGHASAAVEHALDRAAVARDARENHRAIVFELRVDPLSVAGPRRVHEAPIERARDHAHGAARGGHDGEALQREVNQAVRTALQKRDLLSVRAPDGATLPLRIIVVEIVVRELPRRRARRRRHRRTDPSCRCDQDPSAVWTRRASALRRATTRASCRRDRRS